MPSKFRAGKEARSGWRKIKLSEAQIASKNEKPTLHECKPTSRTTERLLEHYQNGRFSDAEKLAVSITKEFPKHQFAWKVLGAVLNKLAE